MGFKVVFLIQIVTSSILVIATVASNLVNIAYSTAIFYCISIMSQTLQIFNLNLLDQLGLNGTGIQDTDRNWLVGKIKACLLVTFPLCWELFRY